MELDIDQHYDKIYKYCYFRLQNRDVAEDITQETFLRYFASETYRDTGQTLQYCDHRLVNLFGLSIRSIPFSFALYSVIAIVAVAVCVIHAKMTRLDK